MHPTPNIWGKSFVVVVVVVIVVVVVVIVVAVRASRTGPYNSIESVT